MNALPEHGKQRADSIMIALHRGEFGWSGELIVNGDSASGATAGTAEGVLDAVWSGAFHDEVGGDAVYTTQREPEPIYTAAAVQPRQPNT